ncbi:MAG: hypothetical protein JO112_19530, partial [Planctomycetes bacterium]|nr:hypothetical protein [Planctomycetota bacterium]
TQAQGPTESLTLGAAHSLGLVLPSPDGWVLTPTLAFLADGAWQSLIAIICHQISYLELAADGPRVDSTLPRAQFEAHAGRYLHFLGGVDFSHREHSRWLAATPELRSCRSLVDLGGGLGTFSLAWVQSDAERSALVLDLPGVTQHIQIPAGLRTRLRTGDLDLNDFTGVPGPADLYLLANVLHLFPDWPRVVATAAVSMPATARLAIFEAEKDTAAGRLFNLQVHMRAGFRAGLLPDAEVEEVLRANGLDQITVKYLQRSDDPFRRRYRLWLARRGEKVRPPRTSS